MITVKNELTCYEINDVEAPVGSPRLIVEDCGTKTKVVRLRFEGKSVAVHADELRKAIDNATNCLR